MPVPGDKIIGVIHTGKGITIHKSNCKTIEKFQSTPEKLFHLDWNDYSNLSATTFRTKLSVLAKNTPGSLNEITSIFSRENANIEDIKILSRTNEFMDMLFTIDVKNLEHMNNIIKSLKNTKVINTVIKYSN